jgi:hypothetical protein
MNMGQAELFLAQAEAAEAAAAATPLENVRERNLRSAAAWRDMAERALKTNSLRGEREAAALARAAAQTG